MAIRGRPREDVGMPMIRYRSGTTTLTAYLAVPAGDGPWPGLVVVHDLVGFRGDVRDQADRLAGDGYLALAPSLYSHGGAIRCVVSTLVAAQRHTVSPAVRDIDAAGAELRSRADCTGRIGVIGFCMGGGFALMSAVDADFDAASVNYGIVPKRAERALAGACPVVASYGGKDRTLRGAAGRLEAALTALDVPHDVKEYPTVGHSFLNDLPKLMTGPLNPMNVVMGIGSRDPKAAEDAWNRIHAFFELHLRTPSKP